MLATCGGDGGAVRLWQANAVALVSLGSVVVSPAALRCVRVGPDCSVACCGDEGAVYLVSGGDVSARLEMGDAPLMSCDVDASGRLIAAGGAAQRTSIWELKRRRIAREFETESTVSALRFDASGTCVASADAAGNIWLHAIRSKRELARLEGEPALAMEFSPTRKHLVAAHEGTTVAIWDASRASLASRLPSSATPDDSCSLAFSPLNQKFLAATGPRGVVDFWDMDAARSVRSLDCGQARQVSFITERQVVVATADGWLVAYDLRNTQHATAKVDAGGSVDCMHLGHQRPGEVAEPRRKPPASSDESRRADVDDESEGRRGPAVADEPSNIEREPTEDLVPRAPAEDPVLPRARPCDLDPHAADADIKATVNAAATDVCLEIENLHLDVLRQFQLQHDQLAALVGDYAAKLQRLVEDNDRLRTENHHLRALVQDLGGCPDMDGVMSR